MLYTERKSKKDKVSPAFVTMIAHGGRHLSEHIAEPEVRYNIRYGEYDYVVLQQAAHPFPGKDILMRDGGKLSKWVLEAKSKMVGYMTWPQKEHPENVKVMFDSYTEFCKENFGILAPVGVVWEQIQKDKKTILSCIIPMEHMQVLPVLTWRHVSCMLLLQENLRLVYRIDFCTMEKTYMNYLLMRQSTCKK